MIAEDYVSFEVAKLLKEKGFDEETRGYYPIKGDATGRLMFGSEYNHNHSQVQISTPTLQMVMKWLRETHNLFVFPFPQMNTNKFWVEIYQLSDNQEWENLYCESIDLQDYPLYEQACEAAVRYCLKNLVKNEDEEEESDIPVPKTVDEAISTLEKILSDEDRDYLLENGAISMHDSLGRWIRNEWGLWTGSELKDELMNMNKGLNHPDDMSNYIIEEFVKYWNNKL